MAESAGGAHGANIWAQLNKWFSKHKAARVRLGSRWRISRWPPPVLLNSLHGIGRESIRAREQLRGSQECRGRACSRLHTERVEEVRVHVVGRNMQAVAFVVHTERYKAVQAISSINGPTIKCATKDVVKRVWGHKVCPTTGKRSTLGRRMIPH
jgi:hypothetical protein